MARIELLAPAKDLHKAKIALLYGADAVYVGGKKFSLRARASNFGLEEIRELVNFAHQMQKKVFITCNIVFHEDDFEGIEEYLTALDEFGVDAIIVESLALVKLVKSLNLKFECHLSTQMNSLNSATIALMKEYGLDRVVIGREASIEEIEAIMEKAV